MNPRQHQLYDEHKDLIATYHRAQQCDLVTKSPHLIKHIPDANWKLQLKAVQSDPNVIRYISEPSEKVKLRAVQNMGHLIELFVNPSLDLQWASIKHDADNIRYIEHPTHEMIVWAIQNVHTSLLYNWKLRVRNVPLTDEYILLCLAASPKSIRHLDDPRIEFQKIAIAASPFNLQHIYPQCEEIQMYALEQMQSYSPPQRSLMLMALENPNENVKLAIEMYKHMNEKKMTINLTFKVSK